MRPPVCRGRHTEERAASSNNPQGKDHISSASKINDRAVRGNLSDAQCEATVDRVGTLRCVVPTAEGRTDILSVMLVSLAICTSLSDLFGRSLETHLTFRQRFADGNFLANIMQLIREFPQLVCAKSTVVVSIIHVASNVFGQVMCRNMRSESILREPLDQMEFQMKRSVRARYLRGLGLWIIIKYVYQSTQHLGEIWLQTYTIGAHIGPITDIVQQTIIVYGADWTTNVLYAVHV